jgi:hypothetical protein
LAVDAEPQRAVDAPVGASALDDLSGCGAGHQAPPVGSSLAVLIGSCYLLWATRPVLSRHAGALVGGLPKARRLCGEPALRAGPASISAAISP